MFAKKNATYFRRGSGQNWHYHFLEHEYHDMIRPIRIIDDAFPVKLPHGGDTHTDVNPAPDNSQSGNEDYLINLQIGKSILLKLIRALNRDVYASISS